jgi:hypothetical protein
MHHTVTCITMSRKTARGQRKAWVAHVVHKADRPQWEGAHYQDSQRAWGLLQFIQKKGA